MRGGWEVSRGEVCHERGVGGQQRGDMPLIQKKIRETKDNNQGCKQILP